jgi:hypothetical protein
MPDHHTLMVRRRIAAGVGLVLLILIALGINSCLNSQKTQALKAYNENVSKIIEESDQKVSGPFFSTLINASSKPPLNVEVEIDQLRMQAQLQASHAKSLNVPGDMAGAQRNLLLTLDFRTEGLANVASLLHKALGGQEKQIAPQIAGDMEIFLASDVVYSQRVAPLIAQTLATDGIHEQTPASSHFLPNLGWLDPNTLLSRLTGQAAGTSQNAQIAPGTHGHSLAGVSVGASTLQPVPALNHVRGGTNPTFTVMVKNAGSNPETNVKVEINITNGGKQIKASKVINKTEPEATANVDIPVTGIVPNVASKIAVNIQPVPGETNVENNKNTYDAVFGP